jgi:hypothetical protein
MASEARGLRPLLLAFRAAAARIERIPYAPAVTPPPIGRARAPSALRAADLRASGDVVEIDRGPLFVVLESARSRSHVGSIRAARAGDLGESTQEA